MPLYFAYGSNMNRTAMTRRCPNSRAVGQARLMQHRFVVMREGYASVVRDPASCVYGLLWDVALRDVDALDRYEGVAEGLYRKITRPIMGPGGPRRVLLYVGANSGSGSPRTGYMETIIAAAESLRLPAHYVAELRELLPRRGAVDHAARAASGAGTQWPSASKGSPGSGSPAACRA